MNLEDEIEEDRAQLGIMLECAEVKNAQQEHELAQLRAEVDRLKHWENGYFDVADALTRESTGVKDLVRQATEIREERDALRARVAELEEDGKRLDWLEKDGNLHRLDQTPISIKSWEFETWEVRLAIDAARQQP